MRRFFGVLPILMLLAVAAVALAQTEKMEQSRARLEFVLSKFEGDRKVSDTPLFLLLPFNQKGVLRNMTPVPDLSPDLLPPCFIRNLPQGRSLEEVGLGHYQVGTQVDSTVSPMPEGKFGIQISITERTLAGCRTVANVDIPVFSNRIIAHSVTLRDGETAELMFSVDKAANTSSRLMVKLTIVEKP
jgi:hypothetical protein